ncbi:DUF3850 domain-containing protein [Flavobacterium sp. B183]|uniref:DUF3850 domain-containing protein n=1 Tax=Flavobacterium sp. B183 TaxID=907046 RepID=UPI0035317ED2
MKSFLNESRIKNSSRTLHECNFGIKKVEVRKNDRNFQERDILILNEYNPKTERYTGNQIKRKVDFVVKNVDGLDPEYVVLQISKLL